MDTILSLTPVTHLLTHDRWNDGAWGPGPWFLVFPLLFWTAVVVFVVLARRRFQGRSGEGTLRDAYARGEITETEYRARLAVLRQTRR